MAVPTTFSELNVTPASNAGLVDNTTAVEQIDNHLQAIYAFMASVYANSGNGWAGVYLPTASPSYTGTLTGGTGVVNLGSGQFYKDATGLVGVGTTTPQFRLSVATTGDTVGLSIGEAGSATGKTVDIGYYITGNYGRIQATHAGTGFRDLALNPSGGNVGIGTTTPGAKLHVNGSVRFDVAVTTTNAGAGGADALPAAPAGYATVNIGGVDRKIPYYP